MADRNLKMEYALITASILIIILGNAIVTHACNIEPDESIRLQAQASRKEAKIKPVAVKTKKKILPIMSDDSSDAGVNATLSATRKGGLKPRIMSSNNSSLQNSVNDFLTLEAGIKPKEQQSDDAPIDGEASKGENDVISGNPTPVSWLDSYALDQSDNLFSNDVSLERQTGTHQDNRSHDISQNNYTSIPKESKNSEKNFVSEKSNDSITQENEAFSHLLVANEKSHVEHSTESLQIQENNVLSTEPDPDSFQFVPLLETQTPWLLDESTSVQASTDTVNEAQQPDAKEKSNSEILNNLPLRLNESTPSTGGNIKISSLSNGVKDTPGIETSTEYNYIRPTRTIHNTTVKTTEMISTDTDSRRALSSQSLEEPQPPAETHERRLDSAVEPALESKATTESNNYTPNAVLQDSSHVTQIVQQYPSEDNSQVDTNVENIHSVPYTASTLLRANTPPAPTTPLANTDGNERQPSASTTNNYEAVEQERSNNVSVHTTDETTYEIPKESSALLRQLTKSMRRNYDDRNFPGKHSILESQAKMNFEELKSHPGEHNLESTIDPFKITDIITYDSEQIPTVLEDHSSIGYKSSLEYDSKINLNSESSYRRHHNENGIPPQIKSIPDEIGCTVTRSFTNTDNSQRSEEQAEGSILENGRKSSTDYDVQRTERNKISKVRLFNDRSMTENSTNNSRPDLFYMIPLHKLKVNESYILGTSNEEDIGQSTTTGLPEKQSDNETSVESWEHLDIPTNLRSDSKGILTENGEIMKHFIPVNETKEYNSTSTETSFQERKSFVPYVSKQPNIEITTSKTPLQDLVTGERGIVTSNPREKLSDEFHVTHSELPQMSDIVTESQILRKEPRTSKTLPHPLSQEGQTFTEKERNSSTLHSGPTGVKKHSIIIPVEESKEDKNKSSQNVTQVHNTSQTLEENKNDSKPYFPISDGVSFIGLNGITLFPTPNPDEDETSLPLPFEEQFSPALEFPQWPQLPNIEQNGFQNPYQSQKQSYFPDENMDYDPFPMLFPGQQDLFNMYAPFFPTQRTPPRETYGLPGVPINERPPINSDFHTNQQLTQRKIPVQHFSPQQIVPISENSPEVQQRPSYPNLQNDIPYGFFRRSFQPIYHFDDKESNSSRELTSSEPSANKSRAECKYYPVNQLRVCVESVKEKNNLLSGLIKHLGRIRSLAEENRRSAGITKHALQLSDESLSDRSDSESVEKQFESNKSTNATESFDEIKRSPQTPLESLDKNKFEYAENAFNPIDVNNGQIQKENQEYTFSNSQLPQNYPGSSGDLGLYQANSYVNRPVSEEFTQRADQFGQNQNYRQSSTELTNYPENVDYLSSHRSNSYENVLVDGYHNLPQDTQVNQEAARNGRNIIIPNNYGQFSQNDRQDLYQQIIRSLNSGFANPNEVVTPEGQGINAPYNNIPSNPYINNYQGNDNSRFNREFLQNPFQRNNQFPNNEQITSYRREIMPSYGNQNDQTVHRQNDYEQFLPHQEISANPAQRQNDYGQFLPHQEISANPVQRQNDYGQFLPHQEISANPGVSYDDTQRQYFYRRADPFVRSSRRYRPSW